MRAVGEKRVQAEDFARAGDLEDESLPFAVGGEQLRASLAEDINAPSLFPFHEDNGALWIGTYVLDKVERFLGGFRELAEELGVT